MPSGGRVAIEREPSPGRMPFKKLETIWGMGVSPAEEEEHENTTRHLKIEKSGLNSKR
jgi:hypothetical protein